MCVRIAPWLRCLITACPRAGSSRLVVFSRRDFRLTFSYNETGLSLVALKSGGLVLSRRNTRRLLLSHSFFLDPIIYLRNHEWRASWNVNLEQHLIGEKAIPCINNCYHRLSKGIQFWERTRTPLEDHCYPRFSLRLLGEGVRNRCLSDLMIHDLLRLSAIAAMIAWYFSWSPFYDFKQMMTFVLTFLFSLSFFASPINNSIDTEPPRPLVFVHWLFTVPSNCVCFCRWDPPSNSATDFWRIWRDLYSAVLLANNLKIEPVKSWLISRVIHPIHSQSVNLILRTSCSWLVWRSWIVDGIKSLPQQRDLHYLDEHYLIKFCSRHRLSNRS